MRELLKAAARVLALLVVLPLLAYYHFVRLVVTGHRVLESCSQLLALVPGLPGRYIRRAFFARTLSFVGDTAVISFGVVFSSPDAKVGNGSYIGPFCTIGSAHIEADTLIAAGAQIPSGPRTHGIHAGHAIRDQEGAPRVVRIGPGAWVGNNAVIMADVGAESIVGAGAVVTRPIPARTIAAGAPARPIRSRDDTDGAGA